ncbi:MAG TPA: NACHT domain-containing protein [Chloroflexi bacterium]|nr:NACHT domain-containing protein [Chloroflexota bacterium]
MSRFFRLPDFSPFWFWTGVLAGSLFWYALTRLHPLLQGWQQRRAARRAERESARLERLASRWLRWLEQHLQGQHLAASLFPLERILIPPKVIAPLPAYVPEGEYRPDDIAAVAVPYTPDFPELAALYRYPALPLEDALQGGAYLLLLGRYGTGKSTALAYLALLAARRDQRLGALQNAFPVLVHVADLPLPLPDDADPTEVLTEAASRGLPPKMDKGFRTQLNRALTRGMVLLLLDGADEMAPTRQPAVAAFLKRLLHAQKRIRVVAAASPEYDDGLQAVGLQPVTLAPWSAQEAAAFLKRWGEAWQALIAPQLEAAAPEDTPPPDTPDPRLLNRWLLPFAPAYHPLELTLKAWAAYAGDALGASLGDAILAFLRRTLPEDERSLPALEALALQLTLSEGDSVPAKAAGKRTRALAELPEEPETAEAEDEAEDEAAETVAAQAPAHRRKPKVRRLLPQLLESGVLVAYRGDRVGFLHPTLRGYLAGRALAAEGGAIHLLQSDWWEGRTDALGFLAATGGGSAVATGLLEKADVVTHAHALAAGRALAYGGTSAWRAEVLRYLAALLTDTSLALVLRARAVNALARSGEKGLGVLFRKLMGHHDLTVRWLGALGAGAVRDAKSVNALAGLLHDPSRAVQRAAALALVAVNTPEALETVAALLLDGDDTQRRIAAEALANHPEEGYPTLRDAAGHKDDLRLRRAAVYGLARVPEAWARETLEEMQVKDSQWVVRDTAAAVLEQAKAPSPFMPRPLRPLHEEPWLLAFAAERGMGVGPGQPALSLLHRVVEEGTPEQQEAALARVPYFPGEEWGREIYDILYDRPGPLRDAAFHAIWQLAIAGVQLPPPSQYGFS